MLSLIWTPSALVCLTLFTDSVTHISRFAVACVYINIYIHIIIMHKVKPEAEAEKTEFSIVNVISELYIRNAAQATTRQN